MTVQQPPYPVDPGRLILVVGPSGAGKDSCIDWAAQHAASDRPICKAHRYITRPAGPGETHIPLDQAQFEQRRRLGAFCCHWSAHGGAYGLGIEVVHWLAAGACVLASASRAALSDCCAAFEEVLVAHVDAPPERLAERLAQRGREDRAAILLRLERQPRLLLPANARLCHIDNGGELATAGRRLLQFCTSVDPTSFTEPSSTTHVFSTPA